MLVSIDKSKNILVQGVAYWNVRENVFAHIQISQTAIFKKKMYIRLERYDSWVVNPKIKYRVSHNEMSEIGQPGFIISLWRHFQKYWAFVFISKVSLNQFYTVSTNCPTNNNNYRIYVQPFRFCIQKDTYVTLKLFCPSELFTFTNFNTMRYPINI